MAGRTMRGIEIPNRILTLFLSGMHRRWHFRAFLVVSLVAGLIAVAIGTFLGISQACNGPTKASNVAGATSGSAIGGRPYLGITYVPITAHMAAYYGLSTSSGVLVTHVALGSPAQKAGLQPDDIIAEFDGLVLSDDVTIIGILNQRDAGQGVEVNILRRSEWLRLDVTLGLRPRN